MHDVSVPDSVRPEGKAAAEVFRPTGHFKYRDKFKNVDIYAAPLPVHSNLLSTRLKGTHSFGSGSPPDFELSGLEGEYRFDRGAKAPMSFGFTRDYLLIGVPAGAAKPETKNLQIEFPTATRRENSLNLATSGLTPEAFTIRSLNIDRTTHNGVFLPAPATATWTVPVPVDGVLTFEANVLPPAIVTESRSDGAKLVIEIVDGEEVVELHTAQLQVGRWSDQRVDLSDWANKTVELRLRTETGDNGDFDYVFLAGPTVYTPSETPRRVVLVFIDTLRPDHMGMYGYDRPTTPSIDQWAKQAAVFENTRTVAPWTLPSARAVLSGRQPEDWYEHRNLPEIMSAAGYHTEAIVANAFLSEPFDMDRGWSVYSYHHLLDAPDVVSKANAILDAHPDRDLFMMVHFMDPHLPYYETSGYKRMFAGKKPASLRAVSRRELVKVDKKHKDFDAIRKHVVDRYDQNIRMVDDNLIHLLESVGRDATVVLFSDHGEEFWEHGYFEHGHNFHDELLRVPLAIRSPYMQPGRIDAPTSLLDIAPTVLELEGLSHDIEDAHSLVSVAFADDGAAEALAGRSQAFGRPLYFGDGWAVLDGGKKWISRYGEQKVFDLDTDAVEQKSVGKKTELSPFAEALQTTLDRDVKLAWRLSLFSKRRYQEVTVNVTHPNGIEAAWAGYDPRGKSAKVSVTVEEGKLQIVQPKDEEMPAEIFIVPAGPPTETAGLEVEMSGNKLQLRGSTVGDHEPASARTVLLVKGDKSTGFEVDFAVVPMPGGVAVSGYHEDMEAQLAELGYLDKDEEEKEEKEDEE